MMRNAHREIKVFLLKNKKSNSNFLKVLKSWV